MPLLKDGRIATDLYVPLEDGAALPETGAIVVTLEQWRVHRDALLERDEPIGIRLRSDEKPTEIAGDIRHFSLIALEFPAFNDGRAYSYARLLRERYGYAGELRAVGDVLLEQLHFMHRVGFDAFELRSDDAAREWEIAAADISVWYQPTNDGRQHVIGLRHD